MNVKYFAIAFSLVVLILVIELIRREKMTFKYALTWLVTSALVVLLSVFDGVLGWLSHLAGFALPSNFIFFLLFIFVIFLSLVLTIYANEQNKRSEILAQSVAILEYRLNQSGRESEKGEKGN